MRTALVIIISIMFGACSNPNAETELDDAAEPTMEEFVNEGLSSEALGLVSQLHGQYVMLEEEEGGIYYNEPCAFKEYDVSIAETAEGSDEWELYWLGSWYPIIHAEEDKAAYFLTAEDGESEITFVFYETHEPEYWDFFIKGFKTPSLLVMVEALNEVEIRPCTDAEAIMKELPSTWYEITVVNGLKVIYHPCEDPPGGLTLSAETIDFWTGSDPFPITSMTKSNNEITIVYNSYHEHTIVMHDIYSPLAQFGDGTNEDVWYITEEAKSRYPVVEEECE